MICTFVLGLESISTMVRLEELTAYLHIGLESVDLIRDYLQDV